MAVDGPSPNDTRSILADWIELRALVSTTASCADIVRLQGRLSDSEHATSRDPLTNEDLEEEILETNSSDLADAVFSELEFRSSLLGDAFPFVLNVRPGAWSIRFVASRLSDAGARAYLFCLLVSGLRDGRLPTSKVKEPLEDFARLFQDLAQCTAVIFLGGQGTSFGWPRPDRSGFLDAVNRFASDFQVGEAKKSPPPSSSRQEKDEGIDVIAWRSFADGRAGKLLMLGQVASGNNWQEKSVKVDAERFLVDWFSTKPAHHFIPAMFIACPQYHAFSPVKEVVYDEAVRDRCRRNELNLGLVFDRLRIVETVQKAPLGDFQTLLPRLGTWSDAVVGIAKGAA